MYTLYWRGPEQRRKRRRPDKWFYLGVVLYVLSFVLPAVSVVGEAKAAPGWVCAWIAFFGVNDDSVSPLAVFGGLINPLALAYIVLRIRDRAPGTRWFLALGILAFIPVSWLALLLMHLGIRVGHIAWIAGLLLMISWKDFNSATEARGVVAQRRKVSSLVIRPLSVWISAAAIIVLGGYALDRALTKPTLAPTDLDDFLFDVAIQFNAPEVCGKINRYAVGSETHDAAPGFQISYLQSECYYGLAHATGDLSLCDKVRTARSRGLDGSRYSPNGCRSASPPLSFFSPRYWTKEEAFDDIMRSLGYPDRFSISYRETYNQILYRSDPATRAEFVRRVIALK
jgi:hypothetical protein